MSSEQKVADALRKVVLRLEKALAEGRRSHQIDADDLRETLLSVADELDPQVPELVHVSAACPECGERRMDFLAWQEDETIRCASCQTTYEPA